MLKRSTAAALAALLLSACATLERGPKQRVRVESDPEGALIDTRGCGLSGEERRTPSTLLISRRAKRCTIFLSLDGYQPARVFLERRRDPVPTGVPLLEALCSDLAECNSLEDLIVVAALGGVMYGVSKSVDAAAGSNYVLEPRYVSMALEPERRGESRAPSPDP